MPKRGETEVTECFRLAPETSRTQTWPPAYLRATNHGVLPLLHWGNAAPGISSVGLLLPSPTRAHFCSEMKRKQHGELSFLIKPNTHFSSCWLSSKEGSTPGILSVEIVWSLGKRLLGTRVTQHTQQEEGGLHGGVVAGETGMGEQEKAPAQLQARSRGVWQVPNTAQPWLCSYTIKQGEHRPPLCLPWWRDSKPPTYPHLWAVNSRTRRWQTAAGTKKESHF